MPEMLRRSYCFLVIVLIAGFADAQSFQSRARLDTVIRPGFYAIGITPALSTQLKTDYRDLRIKDSHGDAVPYLMESEIPLLDTARFQSLEIVANTINDSGQTVLVFRNAADAALDGFSMRIKNAAVSRTLRLSGSHDRLKWYSVAENISMDKRFVRDRDNFQEYLSFPLSSYSFFKVVIDNGKNDPLDILSVQRRIGDKTTNVPARLVNPCCSFVRKDSDRITWISIKNPGLFHISQLLMGVASPRFYKRQLDVLSGHELVGNFVVSSDSLIALGLPTVNDSELLVKIYNDDNPPLHISRIGAAQQADSIITYLEPGKSYYLEMNSDNASRPRYDLINFKDSIPRVIPSIGVSEIIRSPAPEKVRADDGNNPWLWPTLIFALIVLGLFTFRLTRDMAKRS